MWKEMHWHTLVILIVFLDSVIVSGSKPPPFTFVQSYTSAAPYPPTLTPPNIANIESIIRTLSNTTSVGSGGLTANDIVKLQEIASISNETLQSASAYLKRLAENYNRQKQDTSSNLKSLSDDRLWPADNPSHVPGMGGESWTTGGTWSWTQPSDDQMQSVSQTPPPVSNSAPYRHGPIKYSDRNPETPTTPANTTSSSSLPVALGAGIGVLLLLIVTVIFAGKIIRKRRVRKILRDRTSSNSITNFCENNQKKVGVKSQSSYLSEKEQHTKMHTDKTSPWMLEKSRLVVFHEMKLGSGAFCDVYKGAIKGMAPVCKINPSLIAYGIFKDCMCAVKMLPPFADDIARSDFVQEITFMKSLKYHPHLVSMLGICTDVDQNLMLLTEYCDLGDLLHLVRNKKEEIIKGHTNEYIGLRIKDLVSFGWQISDGLEYLSSIGCVHRDVAARNVLVNAANVCKIADFGLCRLSDTLIYTGRGGRLPLKWMAPESLRSYEYSNKTDVWSYGVLLYETFSFGEVPYALLQTTEILSFLESGSRLSRPEYCPADIYTLMLQCWQYEAKLRPNFTEICSYLRVILENSAENYGYVEAIEAEGNFTVTKSSANILDQDRSQ